MSSPPKPPQLQGRRRNDVNSTASTTTSSPSTTYHQQQVQASFQPPAELMHGPSGRTNGRPPVSASPGRGEAFSPDHHFLSSSASASEMFCLDQANAPSPVPPPVVVGMSASSGSSVAVASAVAPSQRSLAQKYDSWVDLEQLGDGSPHSPSSPVPKRCLVPEDLPPMRPSRRNSGLGP